MACASRGAGPAAGTPAAAPPPGRVRLLVRGDDMGSTHGANLGVVQAYEAGIVRSAEVIVPGPWFPEAVQLLRALPGLDVGVHLCLTSEWENARWRPLTRAPSLVDEDGFFYPTVRQRKSFPPGTGLIEAGPRLDEVEGELRAQIELLLRHVPRTSHVSPHMGAVNFTPEWKAIAARLCDDYGLLPESAGPRGLPMPARPPGARPDRNDQEPRLVEALERVPPGDYLLIEHPATDDPEMRAIGHLGYYDVAVDRAATTRALTSPRVQEVVRRRAIELVGYPAFRGA
jgi:hypothetical protein